MSTKQFLAWLVRGAVDFYTDSCNLLPKPIAVKEAERVYCADNDILGDFVSQHCEVGVDLLVPMAVFSQVALAAGVPRTTLTSGMASRGFSSGVRRLPPARKNVRCYLGLTLRQE